MAKIKKCRLLQMIGESLKRLHVHCLSYQIHGLRSQILITYRLANTCNKSLNTHYICLGQEVQVTCSQILIMHRLSYTWIM